LSLALAAAYFKTTDSSTSGAVFFNPPFLPFVIGVRTAEQITTSSSDLLEMGSPVRLEAKF